LLAEAISIDPRLMTAAQADTDFASLKSSPKFNSIVQGAGSNEVDSGSIAH